MHITDGTMDIGITVIAETDGIMEDGEDIINN
jgi:hypothetical protein